MFDALKHESFADFLANHWLFFVFWGWIAYTALAAVVGLFKDDSDS